MDLRKIYEVRERYNRRSILQVRYIPAHTRSQAKQIYDEQHRLQPDTRLTANLASSDITQFIDVTTRPAQSYQRLPSKSRRLDLNNQNRQVGSDNMKKSSITKETEADDIQIVQDKKAGVVFYEARYGDRWGCPTCLEFRRIDGQKALFGLCSCTKAAQQGKSIDDPTAVWNQPGYTPAQEKWIDWENAEVWTPAQKTK